MPQDNTWSESWETFFDKSLRHVLKVRQERAGPNVELEALIPALFEKVIPRLLRPLESNGRKIQPSLVHGDLWYGNVGVVDKNTRGAIVFDPSSFWAHNECIPISILSFPHGIYIHQVALGLLTGRTWIVDEFGNWRPKRNKFTDPLFGTSYHSHITKSDPENDYDDRNALYAV